MGDESKKLECPFTWEIDETLPLKKVYIDFNEEPLLSFIISVSSTYIATKKDNENVIEMLKSLDDCWKKLKECPQNLLGVSEMILFHIKESTKYYIYELTNHKSEAKNILENLEDARNFLISTELKASINGCKSVFWLTFFQNGYQKATELAKLATLGNPQCPLWHYIFAKCLRYARTYDYFHTSSAEEETSIIKSYELSNALFYKIRLADLYKINGNPKEAKIIYHQIYQAKPSGQDILLRLATGLSSFGEFEKARTCFDRIEKHPDPFKYYFYYGVFLFKIKEYEKAAFHFREASTMCASYKSDCLYAGALSKYDESFDFIGYLKTMLEKYSNDSRKEQLTLLHIAMNYYYIKNDLQNTLMYLLNAIEIDPKSTNLEKFVNSTICMMRRWDRINIYDFAYERLQESNDQAKSTKEMKDTDKKLHHYIQEYRKSNV